MTYQSFAHYYDQLMDQAPYEQWLYFTQTIIKQYQSKTTSILDLGCGTGEISARLAKSGYDVTGVDLSSEMLSIANQKTQERNLSVTWVEQDIRTFNSSMKYDLAVSYCDVVNYITDPQDLKSMFTHIYQALQTDGLFMFDIHSENYIEFLTNQTFAEVRDEVSYIWFCDEGEEPLSVQHDLSFFVKNDRGSYDRFDEFHEQRTFPVSFYQETLQQIGFDILGTYSDFSTDSLDEQADRIFFVCKK
ncbi:class I SAM-dependent DNA methyltransferase [Salinibacillus xinjiangensis]|uniref:Methyltransferase domain-containing protein n=1 Tax=Salinibacillus xinjiangensis TaxID=1229268 RepID=A0A6G1X6M9_9BACI|nr:class I SAM-dependent methyltransferase [Salinibacillus xinjiangensis]MRG86661.1 methyltransferase domain-containing protein [Salinibacillus xinjiangensis]